jgi:hypothetical protein
MSDDQVLDPKTSGDTAAPTAVPADMHAQHHKHDHQVVPSDPALRTKALESLLVEKGLVDPAALDAIIDTYENKIGPRNGARVVARAWVDPGYKERLLQTPIRAAFCVSLERSWPKMSRSGYGTARLGSTISCCRSGHPAPRT